ncbi:acyl carrier protein [Erwinia sp. V71]|uniref:acyl carrier protein n=1 Tax=Erwinia sp. V71 TaxID=3369424 RepID=UPI003F60D062
MDDKMHTIHQYITSRDDFEGEVGLDDDLFSSGILDSMGLLGLLSYLEDVYNTTIDLSEIEIDKISTIRKLSQLLA